MSLGKQFNEHIIYVHMLKFFIYVGIQAIFLQCCQHKQMSSYHSIVDIRAVFAYMRTIRIYVVLYNVFIPSP